MQVPPAIVVAARRLHDEHGVPARRAVGLTVRSARTLAARGHGAAAAAIAEWDAAFDRSVALAAGINPGVIELARVRTAAGAKRYGQPIGSLIVRKTKNNPKTTINKPLAGKHTTVMPAGKFKVGQLAYAQLSDGSIGQVKVTKLGLVHPGKGEWTGVPMQVVYTELKSVYSRSAQNIGGLKAKAAAAVADQPQQGPKPPPTGPVLGPPVAPTGPVLGPAAPPTGPVQGPAAPPPVQLPWAASSSVLSAGPENYLLWNAAKKSGAMKQALQIAAAGGKPVYLVDDAGTPTVVPKKPTGPHLVVGKTGKITAGKVKPKPAPPAPPTAAATPSAGPSTSIGDVAKKAAAAAAAKKAAPPAVDVTPTPPDPAKVAAAKAPDKVTAGVVTSAVKANPVSPSPQYLSENAAAALQQAIAADAPRYVVPAPNGWAVAVMPPDPGGSMFYELRPDGTEWAHQGGVVKQIPPHVVSQHVGAQFGKNMPGSGNSYSPKYLDDQQLLAAVGEFLGGADAEYEMPLASELLHGKKLATLYGTEVTLTPAEKNAITSYTGSAYHDLNKRLRLGLELTPSQQAMVSGINSAAGKYRLPSAMSLTRGFSANPGFPTSENFAPGDIYEDRGVTSLAYGGAGWGGSVKWTVYAPEGLNVISVGGSKVGTFGDGEKEVIMAPNTRYMVISDETVDGVRQVVMMALPGGGAQ